MSRKGFTLLELIIAVAILVLVVYLLVNAYQKFLDEQRMNSVIEGAISIIQKAREQTLSSNGNTFYSIHVDDKNAATPNRIILFKGNDYSNPSNVIETFTVSFPVTIDSKAFYPHLGAFNEISFDRITGGVSTINGATTRSPLDTATRSSIFFRSQRTGNTRSIRIYRSGVIETRALPDIYWFPFDEGSPNTVAYDKSRYQYIGNLSGNGGLKPTWVSSVFPDTTALDFSGSNKWVNILRGNNDNPVNLEYTNRGPVTIGAWIKNSNYVSYQSIYQIGGHGNAAVLGLTNQGRLRFLVRYAYGATVSYRCIESQSVLSNFIPNNQWGYVAGVLTTAGMNLYTKGPSQASLTAIPVYSNNSGGNNPATNCISNIDLGGVITEVYPPFTFPFTWNTGFGSYNNVGTNSIQSGESALQGTTGGAGEFFNGVIDELKVWNRALTQQELQDEMNTPYH